MAAYIIDDNGPSPGAENWVNAFYLKTAKNHHYGSGIEYMMQYHQHNVGTAATEDLFQERPQPCLEADGYLTDKIKLTWRAPMLDAQGGVTGHTSGIIQEHWIGGFGNRSETYLYGGAGGAPAVHANYTAYQGGQWNLGDAFGGWCYQFMDSLDFYWWFMDSNNADDANLFDEVGGMIYHFAKAVSGRTTPYHWWGLGEDGMGNFINTVNPSITSRTQFEIPEVCLDPSFNAHAEAPNSGLVPALCDAYNNTPCVPIGQANNLGAGTDICFDPYINQMSLVQIETPFVPESPLRVTGISGDRHQFFGAPRMSLTSTVFNSGLAGLKEIAEVTYYHTGTGCYDIAETRKKDIIVNITGVLEDSTFAFACGNLCSNAVIHYSGSGSETDPTCIEQVVMSGEHWDHSHFSFSGHETGTLIWSGSYQLFDPAWSCIAVEDPSTWTSTDTLGAAKSLYESDLYETIGWGMPGWCATGLSPAGACSPGMLLSGVLQTISIGSGLDIPFPDQFYKMNLIN